jgi:hypothetical protein
MEVPTDRRFDRTALQARPSPATTLSRALVELDRRRAEPHMRCFDLQLVVRVADAAAYPALRGYQSASWSAQDARWTTATWPDEVPPDTAVGVLLALPYDLFVPPSRALSPTDALPVAEPIFAFGPDRDALVMGLVAGWAAVPGAADRRGDGRPRARGAASRRPRAAVGAGGRAGRRALIRRQTTWAAAWPDAQAHWKLKPPRWPVTSSTSPMK